MSDDLWRDADLCVKCGMCLPHCPTYQKTQDENESPRGRIALIQAWASGKLPLTKTLTGHLDNCLLCRSCERVCPAELPYNSLVDNFRAQTANSRSDSLALSLSKILAHHSSARRAAQRALHFYRQSGLLTITRKLKLAGLLRLDALERIIPKQSQSFSFGTKTTADIKPRTDSRGRVGLFTGCMGALFDQETLAAAHRMLALAGYNVDIPAQQSCCGALDLHSGDRKRAAQLALQNTSAFNSAAFDAIVTVASGCGGMLQEYNDQGFAKKIIDISGFLSQNKALQDFTLRPLAGKLLLHTPCSLANVMRDADSALQLLQRIPEAEIVQLPQTIKCCGSAGSFMLDHPKMAQALLDDILAHIKRHNPQYVVTSNIGCALHIRAGLQVQGMNLEVLHPVALINRMLI